MKELDLLKKDWQNQNSDSDKFSFNDIYQMILKKSSSIIKWIFIISVIEFAFWHLLYLLPNNNTEVYSELEMMWFIYTTSIIHYIITISFIYYFYKNFKSISNSDTTKTLMEKILKTRKTVYNYVIYNLAAFGITYYSTVFMMYQKKEQLFEIDLIKEQLETLPQLKEIFFLTQSILGIVVIFIFGAIYFLLYGLMLRKLNKNYKELKELEG
ncbi:MAG: hypothetical protein HRT68_11495 [Flavobacteriaceae bacterium]|nr:hypothetical protein [Flavobacteriaceae bacterium]